MQVSKEFQTVYDGIRSMTLLNQEKDAISEKVISRLPQSSKGSTIEDKELVVPKERWWCKTSTPCGLYQHVQHQPDGQQPSWNIYMLHVTSSILRDGNVKTC